MVHDNEKRSMIERKRSLLYLIHQYLTDNRLTNTASCLKDESNLQMDHEVCDNIDLDTIYLEFSSYFQLKFKKKPSVLRRVSIQSENPPGDGNVVKKPIPSKKKKSKGKELNLLSPHGVDIPTETQSLADVMQKTLVVKQIVAGIEQENFDSSQRGRPLRECECYTPEWGELAEIVSRDILKKDFGVRWFNVFGNSKAIEAIKEAVVLPLEHPHLFKGDLRPWRSILLHGPPGTGKTFIAKALCSETFEKVTFFNMSPSTVTSKWRGDSEKIVKVLFETAKFYAPSIIFFDEIESLTSKRDSLQEHEASRRFKNEFLALLDGVGKENEGVFVLANTNLPWEIDPAFLRRFERKIMIDLPSFAERRSMFKAFVPSPVSEQILDELANKAEGFTGDDIRIACKEFGMRKLRMGLSVQKPVNLTAEDMFAILSATKPLGKSLIGKYVEWHDKHGTNF